MPWVKITLSRFGLGHDAGPPPSVRFGWLRISWLPHGVTEMLDKLQRALDAAREELRK